VTSRPVVFLLTLGLPLGFLEFIAYQAAGDVDTFLHFVEAQTLAMFVGAGGVWLWAAPSKGEGFRRCQAPYCRVSRTRTVWPTEYRIATGWGLVHLECRPSARQAQMLRFMASMAKVRRVLGQGLTPATRRATRSMRQLNQVLDRPEVRQPWEFHGAQRVEFRD
jgi:hypothetical protein